MDTPSGRRPFSRMTSDDKDCTKEETEGDGRVTLVCAGGFSEELFPGTNCTSERECVCVFSVKTHVVSINDQFDHVAGVGGQRSHS